MAKTVLMVEGMTCSCCTGKVEKALKSLKGVTSVSMDLKKGKATVEHDDLKEDALIMAVLDAGFKAKVKHGLF